MAGISKLRIAASSLALVVGCGAALVYGATNLWRAGPAETTAATVAPAASPAAVGARDDVTAALATVEAKSIAKAIAAVPELAVSPASPAADEKVPAFDLARIERSGEAVIAGRAAPGATVELLRNGDRHDQAVADASGQFVMVPPRLPPGNYELTLRSELPDGTIVLSKRGVAVALGDVAPSSEVAQSRAEAPFVLPATASQAPSYTEKARQPAVAQLMHPTRATPLADQGSSSPGIEAKTGTKVVSRGDSLWRISRLIYGVGTRYEVVYRANREQIRDPNRIYPGQVFVLPAKAR
jgi:nucleoid-associated protein YgaU